MKRLPVLVILLLTCPAAIALEKGESKNAVSIENKKFTPATINIGVGESVKWTNSDDHDHTVVADDGSFKSGNIGSGQTFEHRFKKAGTFSYSCTYHPRMKGKVVVGGD
jgi:plastocyanin